MASYRLLILWAAVCAICAAGRDPRIERAEKAIDAGEYGTAVRLAREARQHCETSGDPTCTGQSYVVEGLAGLYEARYADAETAFQAALSRFEKTQERAKIADTRNNLGAVAFYRGAYAEALSQYQAANATLKGAEKESWYAAAKQLTDGNMAALLQRLGRYRDALDLYRGLGANPSGLSPSEHARLLTNLGALYRRMGDPYKASDQYDAARALLSRDQHADALLGVLKNQGILHVMETGDYATAHRLFAEGRAHAHRSGSAREEMQFRMYAGEALFREGDLAGAEREWRAVLAESERLGTVEEQWKSLHGLGRVALRGGSPKLASERLEVAAKTLESVRGRIAGTSLRLDFLFDKHDVYDDWIEAERRSARTERLVEIMERARARVLRDQVAAAISADPKVEAQLKPVRERIAAAAKRPDGLTARLAAESEYEALEARLQAERLPGAVMAPITHSISWARAELQEGQAALIYWVGKRRSFLLWASQDRSGIADLGPGERAAAGHVNVAMRRLMAGDAGWDNEVTWLLPGIPLWQDTSVRTLSVVLEGALTHVPLDAVRLPDGRRLVERYALSFLPSAAFLRLRPVFHRRAGWPWERQIAAFGDPTPGAKLLPDDERLPNLPGTASELRSIEGTLPGSVLAVTRDEFTHRKVAEEAGKAPMLHIATHAVVDSADPLRSRFLLSDGYFFLSDVWPLRLSGTQLVVLSACQTSEGIQVRGEGAQSLARAFLASGAHAVMSTRWPVEDRATAIWMREFYRHVARGADPAAAMREAKLSFLRRGDAYRDPKFWAAFTMAGQGHQPVPRFLSWNHLLVGSAALLLFGVTVMRLMRFSEAPREEPQPGSHQD
ncbi:MAG: CHAT domain-containing protein [Bryobacterales bacterium]|nr:CHAT domain-containing protein [Bryobacterales bacterium]